MKKPSKHQRIPRPRNTHQVTTQTMNLMRKKLTLLKISREDQENTKVSFLLNVLILDKQSTLLLNVIKEIVTEKNNLASKITKERLRREESSTGKIRIYILKKDTSNIPKFDGKMVEDPTIHTITYHLWHVSNSMFDDSIRLHFFLCTLTRIASNQFIKLLTTSYHSFNALDMEFLTHFQFPIQYKIDTKIPTSLCQNTTTHTYDHIHKCR